MDLKDRIKELCKKNHISMNQLEQDLDFGKGYISKLGKSTPNATKIKQIAEYFNVSVDYLMTGDKPEIPGFEPEHLELIELYSKLKTEQKSAILNLLRSFAL